MTERPDFLKYPNLASARLGTQAIAASDEFFADKSRMLNPEPAVFIPGKYDEHGKWMDGWETRRKRGEGHDWCIVKLGVAGVIFGVDIDTSHFTGNYPPAASLQACYSETTPGDDADWVEIVPSTSLQGNSHHYLAVSERRPFNYLRLNIYPDGGVARLRVHGQPYRDWAAYRGSELIDLIALENGGRIIACNDSHFGAPENLLAPGRGVNMGDGWETRRRREPGNDWVIIALGHAGTIRRVVVDTAHFKGNYPDRCSLQAAYAPTIEESALVPNSLFWRTLLPEQKLQMDHIHTFEAEVLELGPITHVRFNIIPDGGVSRLRLYGLPA
ncbi:MAG TPA: allantoicase [Candidatus Competibacteraceae bacterium]|nr:allantoicase [Candidatus Competibacteraceae bacterium]